MMPVHRRHNATLNTKSNKNNEILHHNNGIPNHHEIMTISSSGDKLNIMDNNDNEKKSNNNNTQNNNCILQKYKWTITGLIFLFQSFITFIIVQKIPKKSTLCIVITTLATLPISLALLATFNPNPNLDAHERYIPLAFIATILGNQLPNFLTTGFAAMAILAFGLASRPVTSQQQQQQSLSSSPLSKISQQKRSFVTGPMFAVIVAFVMIFVLLIDNFMCWVVSATYPPSHDETNLPTPLQDNGKIVLQYIIDEILQVTKRNVVRLRNIANIQWALVTGLGLSFVAVELHPRRNLYTLATRGLSTLTIARSVRVVSFIITVLPSQNPKCYLQKFPNPPPEDWSAWILVGFMARTSGGCNDLTISGHATVISTIACIVVSVVNQPYFTVAVWCFVIMDYMMEIYEGFHYSVDMWLGLMFVNLVWISLKWIEDANDKERIVKQFIPIHVFTTTEFLQYAIPTFGCYMQVAKLLPSATGNYTIICYLIICASIVCRYGFIQYAQHILFCMLYMALGIYL